MKDEAIQQRIQENIVNQATTLDLSDLELTGKEKALKKLVECTHLKELYLGGVQQLPAKLPPNLEVFKAVGNTNATEGIENIRPLRDLKQLKTLELSNQRVEHIAPLQSLPQLEKLDLQGNAIEVFPSEFLADLPQLKALFLQNNPITNLPPEIFDQPNCAQAVRDYFTDLQQGNREVYHAKVILVGSEGVGKTSLFQQWLSGQHFVELEQASGKLIQLEVFDWADKDTYPLLLSPNALVLLVWDVETEAVSDQSITHWLQQINTLSKGHNPVLVVQNKVARDEVQEFPDWEALTEKYTQIKGMVAIETTESDQQNNGLADLEAYLRKIIQQQLRQVCITLPAKWMQVQQMLEAHQQSIISWQDFSQICKQCGVTNGSEATLREYLHSTDFFFSSPQSKMILLDWAWGVKSVQALFHWFDNQGVVKGEDFAQCWSDQPEAVQELLVSWMQTRGLCAQIGQVHRNPTNNDQPLSFGQRQYLFPALLPDEALPNQASTLPEGTKGLYLIFYHPTLNTLFVQQLMLRLAPYAKPDQVTREALYFTHQGQQVFLQALRDQQALTVTILPVNAAQNHLPTTRQYLRQVLLDQGLEQVQEWLSLDGKGYISREALESHPPEQPKIKAGNGQEYDFVEFKKYLNKDILFMPSPALAKSWDEAGLPTFFVQRLRGQVKEQYEIILRYRYLKNNAIKESRREKFGDEITLRRQNIEEIEQDFLQEAQQHSSNYSPNQLKQLIGETVLETIKQIDHSPSA